VHSCVVWLLHSSRFNTEGPSIRLAPPKPAPIIGYEFGRRAFSGSSVHPGSRGVAALPFFAKSSDVRTAGQGLAPAGLPFVLVCSHATSFFASYAGGLPAFGSSRYHPRDGWSFYRRRRTYLSPPPDSFPFQLLLTLPLFVNFCGSTPTPKKIPWPLLFPDSFTSGRGAGVLATGKASLRVCVPPFCLNAFV